MNLKQEALNYLSFGASIIPLRKNKKPYLTTWKEYQTRQPTQDEVEKWWTEYPDAQIGIITGRVSKLAVVDVEFGGDISIFPETDTVTTGNGGWHLYYSYVEGAENRTRAYKLTDVRGEGGYVVAPPSVTDYISDKKGEEGIRKGGEYKVSKMIGRKPFPIHLFGGNTRQTTEWTNIFAGGEQGVRNDTATKVAGKLISAFHPKDWEIAWSLLKSWNEKNNPPLGDYELKNVFQSIAKRDSRNIRPKEDEEAPIMLISEVARLQKQTETEAIKSGIDEFDTNACGGFHIGDLVTISGVSGHGKTTFAQTLSYNLAMNKVSCLWFSYEVMVSELWQKFKNMGVSDEFLAFSPFSMVTGKIDWIEKKIIESKEKFGTKIVFIDHLGFLAPAQKKYDENLAQNFSAYLGSICRELKTIALNHEIVIILLCHTRKTDTPSLHDIGFSGGIAQESDHVFMLYRERLSSGDDIYSPYTTVKLEKNRRTGITKKMTYELKGGRFQIPEHIEIYNDVQKVEVPKLSKESKQKALTEEYYHNLGI